MMQIKLDNRLEAVSHLILPNKPMADIGTDHAYLPVYMIINDLVPYAIATDRVRGPLASAKQLVELLSLDKQVSIRLGEGLKVLQPEEVDTIVISGMGGFTIKDILS
ncbi:MAG: class I SAM-dependent methyltransferase, partial [Clostridiales bacterium]